MEINLNELKQNHKLDKATYKKELAKYQNRLLSLQRKIVEENIGVIIAFEGVDAAGKGGAIKRLTAELDPRGLMVYPISAPKPHEKRYHYLQRFWRKIPQYGQIGIFDRSWYGRVLVERLEGFATNEEWERAYNEINQFEKTLTDDHYILLKFWIQISKEEQLERFEKRQNDPLKSWKITEEDWRNREKWEENEKAAKEMLQRTDRDYAPWVIVEGDNKRYARVKVLKSTVNYIENYLEKTGIELPDYSLFEG
ncbi:polyphosphate kinase 2 family protein [Oceanobacillus massiliensis]|uniref:polyphosphate kinase 2 family protein n=1 Tax=Oceanobacillus massiliensis TaxID=1465765 RepID=UPI00028A00B1|nr:UDP-galactose-lipid carrier transferase [Oceanobacillus massiliensis]